MSKLHFAVDPGSTHMNKKEYVDELVKRSLDSGASSIKFQLFEKGSQWDSNGNIPLDRSLFEYAVKIGEGRVTASVFGHDALKFLLQFNPLYVKYAFSLRESAVKLDIPTVVTCTIWDEVDPSFIKLVTATENGKTIYPNTTLMDFSGLFPNYFNGYSDHSIGWHNAQMAKLAGAQWIERHMKIDKPDINCPDAKFASSDWGKIRHFV